MYVNLEGFNAKQGLLLQREASEPYGRKLSQARTTTAHTCLTMVEVICAE